MEKTRLRIGVKGRALGFWPVRVTIVAENVTTEKYEEIVAFLQVWLKVWDKKDLGGGFSVFIEGEKL